MRFRTLVAVMATLLALPATGRTQIHQAPPPRESPELTARMYEVIDLTSVLSNDTLIQLVTRAVRPESWQANGGRGDIRCGRGPIFMTGRQPNYACALEVTNTPDVLTEVGRFLDALRRPPVVLPACEPKTFTAPTAGFYPPALTATRATAPTVVKCQLTHVGATDAARVVQGHVQLRMQRAVVVAEPLLGSVFVTADPDVQKEVADLLRALDRAPQPVACAPAQPPVEETTLVYQTRLVRVPAGTLENAGVKLSRDVTLAEEQFRKLLEAAQLSPFASVTQFPKITTGADQTGKVTVGDKHEFVTALEAVRVKDQAVLMPKKTAVHVGEEFAVRGRVSADGGFVRVHAELSSARLVGEPKLVPVTTTIA
ncbi:MAG: hypothetical protein K2V38_28895, partial [Gemmataceae bacterium]|nr:hypothetical protein [Gemmataceae bacterium]